MKKVLWIILLAFSISLNAQINIHSPMDSVLKVFKQVELKSDFSNLLSTDLTILYSIPTFRDFKSINLRINELPKDCFRFLDSLDYFMIGKDSMFIKVYSQNYAYQSSNSFKLGFEDQENNDTLLIYNVYYNIKMKSIIDDYLSFMDRQFDYSISDKELGDVRKTKRITILKNYR